MLNRLPYLASYGEIAAGLTVKDKWINKINNKIWILLAMGARSFDEPKFTSVREKQKRNNKQKHPKFYNA